MEKHFIHQLDGSWHANLRRLGRLAPQRLHPLLPPLEPLDAGSLDQNDPFNEAELDDVPTAKNAI